MRERTGTVLRDYVTTPLHPDYPRGGEPMPANFFTLWDFFSFSANNSNTSKDSATKPRGPISRRVRWTVLALAPPLMLMTLALGGCGGSDNSSSSSPKDPNIVLIMVDDIGIDQ